MTEKNSSKLAEVFCWGRDDVGLSDENNFFQDQLHNIQNNRWLAYNPYGVPRIMKSKFFHSVMVSAHVSSDGDIMTFYIFELGLGSIKTTI